MDKKILFIGDSFVDNFIYGHGPDDLNLSNSTVGHFWNKLEIQELINDSKASILNYSEIVDSLCKLTPCKKIVHCWDYKKFDSDNIIYREEMTELIGKWETSEEVYERTNGEEGRKGDSHWSDDMNIEFMNFLLKYFKND